MNFVIKTTCDVCGETVFIPPGVCYRGRFMHKQEAEYLRQKDVSIEKIMPKKAEALAILQRLLDVSVEGE